MQYKIISPTGVSVIKTLTEETVNKLKLDKYFQVVSLQPKREYTDPFTSNKPVLRIHKAPQEECESCSA